MRWKKNGGGTERHAFSSPKHSLCAPCADQTHVLCDKNYLKLESENNAPTKGLNKQVNLRRRKTGALHESALVPRAPHPVHRRRLSRYKILRSWYAPKAGTLVETGKERMYTFESASSRRGLPCCHNNPATVYIFLLQYYWQIQRGNTSYCCIPRTINTNKYCPIPGMYTYICEKIVCFRTYLFVRALLTKTLRTSTQEGRPEPVVEV